MSGWLYQPLPLAQADAAAPEDPPLRPIQFANGQGLEHVGNLIGFAGSALLWASAAALLVSAAPDQALGKPYFVAEQQRIEQVQPRFSRLVFEPAAQPHPQATEITFGQHAVAIAQADQSAQFFKASGTVFVQVAGGPPNRPQYFVSQEAQEQSQPVFTGQTPRPAPAFKPWTVPPQESPEQTAPLLFGQQPRPSPAGKPIWTATEEQRGSQAATIWNAAADLYIAATQFTVPPKPFAAAPQESQEQIQPLAWGSDATRFIASTQFDVRPRSFTAAPQENPDQIAPALQGQQPLPSPASKPIWTAAEQQQGSQAANIWNAAADLFIAAEQFTPPPQPTAAAPQESTEQPAPLVWGGDATLFIAATQFDVRPRAFSAGPQESPEQTQPVVVGQEPPSVVADEVTVRQFSAGPDESTEQIQPVIFGQVPASALADEITIRQFSAGPQESEEQTQPDFDRAFFAPVPIRTIAAGPQEGLEQAQPWFGRQYRPAVERPFLRPIQAAPEESQEQVQPVFARAYFAPLVAPAPRQMLFAAPQESLEQPAALIFRPYQLLAVILESPAQKPHLFAAPQESGEQEQPRFARPYYPAVGVEAPAFRQFFVPEQVDAQELQPVFVNLPLPDSQVVPPQPPVVGGGGDRGVILFREPKPEPRQIPKPAKFAVSFFQDGQHFTARVDSESFLAFNGVSEAGFDFSARVDASSTVSYRSDQAQKFTAAVSVSGQVRSFAPVKATFTATRLRVVFAQSTNQMHCKIEVES